MKTEATARRGRTKREIRDETGELVRKGLPDRGVVPAAAEQATASEGAFGVRFDHGRRFLTESPSSSAGRRACIRRPRTRPICIHAIRCALRSPFFKISRLLSSRVVELYVGHLEYMV